MGIGKNFLLLATFACALTVILAPTITLAENTDSTGYSPPATDSFTGTSSNVTTDANAIAGGGGTNETNATATISDGSQAPSEDAGGTTTVTNTAPNETLETYTNSTPATLNASTLSDEGKNGYKSYIDLIEWLLLNQDGYYRNYSKEDVEWLKGMFDYIARRAATLERDLDARVDVTAIKPSAARITIQRIRANHAVRIAIERTRELAVTSLDIAVKNEVSGEEVNVERHLQRPAEVRAEPPRNVYQYLEIKKQRIADEDVSDVGINFKVEKSWMSMEKIANRSLIALYRLVGGEWKELPTMAVSEDYENVYYESVSPGLSYFVIGITAAVTSPIEVEITPDKGTQGAEGGSLFPESPEDIVKIRFSWIFVVMIVALLLLLKFTSAARKLSGLLNRESEEDLQARLSRLEAEKKEALVRYYKTQIGEHELKDIVSDIKKKHFEIEMKLKRLQEKHKPPAPKA